MLFGYTHYSSQPIRSTEILPIDNEAVTRFLETSTFEQPVLKESVYGKQLFDEDDLVYHHTIDEIAPGKISHSDTFIISKGNAKEEQYHDLINLTIHGNDLNTPYHVSFRQFFNGSEPDEFFLVVENLLSGKITLKDLSGVYDFSVYTSGNDQYDPEFERSLASFRIADNSLFLIINEKDVLAVEFDFSKDDTTKVYSLKSDFWEQFYELKSGFKKIYTENNMSLALETADKNVYYYYPFTNH